MTTEEDNITIRDMIVDKETKARLENVAWAQRSTMTDLVHDLIEDVVAGKYRDADLSLPMGEGRARLGFRCSDSLWEAFADAAWRMRTSRTTLMRVIVNEKYADTPTDRAKVVLP